jgi:hypothetical protein
MEIRTAEVTCVAVMAAPVSPRHAPLWCLLHEVTVESVALSFIPLCQPQEEVKMISGYKYESSEHHW